MHDLAGARAPIGVSVLCPGFVPTGIGSSARNRQSELRNERPPTEAEKRVAASLRHAIENGRLSASDIATQTLDAVRSGRFTSLRTPSDCPPSTAAVTTYASYATRPWFA